MHFKQPKIIQTFLFFIVSLFSVQGCSTSHLLQSSSTLPQSFFIVRYDSQAGTLKFSNCKEDSEALRHAALTGAMPIYLRKGYNAGELLPHTGSCIDRKELDEDLKPIKDFLSGREHVDREDLYNGLPIKRLVIRLVGLEKIEGAEERIELLRGIDHAIQKFQNRKYVLEDDKEKVLLATNIKEIPPYRVNFLYNDKKVRVLKELIQEALFPVSTDWDINNITVGIMSWIEVPEAYNKPSKCAGIVFFVNKS
ncbi:hypothetical protein ACQZV8_11100 [Magnetococcales bacterium HHB-1]